MNDTAFNQMAKKANEAADQVLLKKGMTYSSKDNRLENFEVIAEIASIVSGQPIHPGLVALIYTLKPIISLARVAIQGLEESEPPIYRYADIRNYALLMLAMTPEGRNFESGSS